MNQHYYTVIMAGGVGKRFWPLSREDHPKQFIDILGQGKTLFQATFQRCQKFTPTSNILVVTNEAYIDLVKEQVPDIQDDQILTEPIGRNTAPCVAYAAHHIHAIDPDGVMMVAPSDHLIMNEDEFSNTILKGLDFAAENDVLITLGIRPTRPDTGYGYIQMSEDDQNGGLNKVKTFTEKPDQEWAEYFVNSGEFLWNSGIFIWHARTILSAFQKHMPELEENFEAGQSLMGTEREQNFIADTYPTLPKISIDYGIMEKAENVYVLPADFQWSDIGTWNAVYDLLEKDEKNNAITGKHVFTRNTKDCLINVSDKNKLVALNNVDNLIVVDTGSIMLIADKNQEQEVRQVVNEIKAQYGERYT